MNRLLILSKKRETYQNLLRSNKTLDRIELTDDISEANIILGEPPLVKDQLMLAKKLEWFQSIYTGVESIINTPSATNYQLTNVREGMGPLISEYILGYCIIHFRHLLQYHHLQQQNLWKPATYQSIHSKKMLIIGTGAIGQHLAHTASAF